MKSLKYFRERVAIVALLNVQDSIRAARIKRTEELNEKYTKSDTDSLIEHNRTLKRLSEQLDRDYDTEYSLKRYLYNRLGEGTFQIANYTVRISKGMLVSVEIKDNSERHS